jgi:hypothetical protein
VNGVDTVKIPYEIERPPMAISGKIIMLSINEQTLSSFPLWLINAHLHTFLLILNIQCNSMAEYSN